MNNLFNIKRFGLVLRKDVMENWKRYLLLFLTMLGVITIITTWISFDYPYGSHLNYNLLKTLSAMFGIFGLLFASTFMNPMNSKIKKITYLTNPSSNFEKFLSRWIIVTVGYIISFFLALCIADIFRVGICSVRYPDTTVTFLDLTRLICPDNNWLFGDCIFSKELFIISTAAYFLFQSLFILGSTFWEKSTFIKTFTAGALLLLSYILICRWAILIIYRDFGDFGNALEFLVPVNIDREQALVLVSCVMSLFTLINWTLAYFRFRESEIIKRL